MTGANEFALYFQVPVVAIEKGVLKLSSSERVTLVRVDSSHRYLACLVSGTRGAMEVMAVSHHHLQSQHSGVELYQVRSPSELEQLLKKRRRKAAKKSSGNAKASQIDTLDKRECFKLICRM